ncbi:hypothetical protein [Aliiruegeria sabulilitoris]|uniref:hypothetical protein n=1 Tax=Aliiruegeria sabulilitoris TaxID=1510458 RepID=UPI001E3DFFF3|nr:hypothetical protein [Aliiruegeria sabulilitoris]
MTQSDECWRRRLVILAVAMSWLTGCATSASDVGNFEACPPVDEYSQEFQAQAAQELARLP